MTGCVYEAGSVSIQAFFWLSMASQCTSNEADYGKCSQACDSVEMIPLRARFLNAACVSHSAQMMSGCVTDAPPLMMDDVVY